MGQYRIDVNDGGVLHLGGEEVLLLALHRSAVPVDLDGWQHLATGQGLVHQRCCLVQRAGEDERLVHPLTGG
ncbi:hypothetical protein D3C76_1486970 [compost metagenome]